ncbi:MAG: IS1595 family transposase [Nocardioidaceae bacterium]
MTNASDSRRFVHMSKQEFSIPKLAQRLQTEADAYLMLEELRWGGAPEACPKCGGMGRCHYLAPKNGSDRATRTGKRSQRRVWFCGHCRKQFSVLTDTIFHGTRIGLRTWLLVIFDFCSAKNSMSAWEVSRKYEITNESAWHMLHRIREAMKREPLAGLFTGTVQADETFVGGEPKNRHRNDPREPNRPYATSDKTAVFSIVNYETREARSRVVADVTGRTLLPAIQEQTDTTRTMLHTDAAKAYRVAAPYMLRHEFVSHAQGEYVRDGVSTNLCEGFFSQTKRSIDGSHHHVSTEHLHRYLAQFDFLYTHCRRTDSERLRTLIGRVDGRRLTYARLIEDGPIRESRAVVEGCM